MLQGLESRHEVEIENVKLRLIESRKFTRISEFFTGKENMGRRIILRSNPQERGGLYFIVKMDTKMSDLPDGIQVGVDFFDAGSAIQKHYKFQLPAERKPSSRLFIGITGDGRLEQEVPVAWRVYLEAATGELVAELKSYLWEMPETH